MLAFDLAPLGELGLYAEAVYAKNLDRSNARNLPPLVLEDDGVDDNQLWLRAQVKY